MNPATRRALRIILLRTAAAAPLGLSMEFAQVSARLGSIVATPEEIQAEVQYLIDKGFLTPVDQKLSPELKVWRITADGRDFLATEGFE